MMTGAGAGGMAAGTATQKDIPALLAEAGGNRVFSLG